jgi:hypothetical protein
MAEDSKRGIPRRAFVKTAVAIGGASALSACLDREQSPDIPQGPDDLSTLPNRQYAWSNFLQTDESGNHIPPRHRLLLYLNYANDGPPTEHDRSTVEQTLRALNHAYPWRHDGLLFTVSYSPAYFNRFKTPLPASVDLPEPEALASFEDSKLDRPDAVIHLASDHGSVVLAAEEALFGEKDTLNGVDIKTTLSSVFERQERRTGFVGDGLPASHQDVDGVPDSKPVPEDSPLYMGFKSSYAKNQASEESVTIGSGPFAGGTTQHISMIRLHLQQWYEQDSRYHRVATMFCPVHAEKGLVEGVGENLGDSSKMAETGCPAHTNKHARGYGVVGHSQKSARARENDSPIILRRDFDSTDDGRATLHFVALQQAISDFVDTRKAMNGTDVAAESAVGQRLNNGILQYMTVTHRGNYLLPPRDRRALPPPQPA